MAKAFGRDELLAAFDEIGKSAVATETQLHLAVFGGSALMLASNFLSGDDIFPVPPKFLRNSGSC
jgi:hypothetical protein